VTGRARQVAAVIQRFKRQAHVLVDVWNPGAGIVAYATVLGRDEVPLILARRLHAIVARRTGPDDLIVIDSDDRAPCGGAVAVLADICRQHVCRMLPGRVDAVVAAEAVVRNVDVVEVRRCPGDGCVAVIAVVATRDVRRVFPGRDDTIVTRKAAAEHLRMVHDVDRRPNHVAMTVFANVRGQDVHWSLAGGFHAIVTTDAVAGDVDVVEVCGGPGDGRMAVVTIVAARDVIERFASRDRTVMT